MEINLKKERETNEFAVRLVRFYFSTCEYYQLQLDTHTHRMERWKRRRREEGAVTHPNLGQ